MKYNDATSNRPEGERVLNDNTVKIDLPNNITEILNEDSWNKNDRNSITLFKNGTTSIVLVALHELAELLPHEAEGTMCFHVLEGSFEMVMEGNIQTIYKEQILAVNKGIFYSGKALEKTIILLTVTDID